MASFLEEYERLLRQEAQLTPERACEILRERWGGSSVYVGLRKRIAVTHADTPATLMEKGLSRASAYRRLRGNWVGGWR